MLASLGPHAAYIIASFIVAALIIGGLLAYTLWDHAMLKRQLKALEQRGLVRTRDGQ